MLLLYGIRFAEPAPAPARRHGLIAWLRHGSTTRGIAEKPPRALRPAAGNPAGGHGMYVSLDALFPSEAGAAGADGLVLRGWAAGALQR